MVLEVVGSKVPKKKIFFFLSYPCFMHVLLGYPSGSIRTYWGIPKCNPCSVISK